ncbi:B12-binding domain-containing radical SAM protein [Candidatus Woesearchaeota archaeon]|nr:B12-binding domain-containing radical SAM protein [Candidatus Woesearchaeota archaeon]MBW3021971.1 B12-binding domain-containing radical SAM protein [Candidatus Woesearchaeota archaeon]
MSYKLDVALVKPPSVGWDRKGARRASRGLVVLAGELMNLSYTGRIAIFDGGFYELDELDRFIADVRSFNPAVLGVAGYTDSMPEAIKILKSFPEIPVKVCGGPYASARTEEMLQYCDAVFVGEAEVSFKKFLESVSESGGVENDALIDVPGISFKNNNGETQYTGKSESVTDLDTLSVRGWELLADNFGKLKSSLYRHISDNMIGIMTSRGCSNRCVFCFSEISIGGYRYRSVESVKAELELIERLRQEIGLPELESVRLDDDDIFLREEDELARLFQMFASKGLTTSGSGTVQTATKEKIELAAKYGLESIFIGVETHEARRKYVTAGPKAEVRDEQIIEVLEMFRKYNVRTATGFIIGFPEETLDDIDLTIETMRTLPADYPMMKLLQIHPGTQLWNWVNENIHLYPELEARQFTHVDRERWSIEPEGLPGSHPMISQKKLLELKIKAHQEAYRDSERVSRLMSNKTSEEREQIEKIVKNLGG